MMDLHELGQRIRTQREKRALKQSDIAGALQISPQAVSKWERGENAPDIGLLPALATLLGVSTDWLLGSTGPDRDVFEATVLASGIIGAREKSEALSPREFAAWTNSQASLITEIVIRHDGVPVKYHGPGLLCFFSAASHQRRAVAAARSAVNAAGERLKIGIATGRIYFGAVGHPDYAQPDIMGEAVSMAMLSMDWAATHTETGIAACGSTTQGFADANVGEPKNVEFGGIHHPVALYEIAQL